MESISSMFPWVGDLPSCEDIEFDMKVYTFNLDASFPFPETQYKFFSNEKDLISEFERKLLFPVKVKNKGETLLFCNAAMLFFYKKIKVFKAYIPQYPSFYGYRVFVIENKNDTFQAIFDPQIDLLYKKSLDLMKAINLIPIPYKICDDHLLNSCKNIDIKNWLNCCSDQIKTEISSSFLNYLQEQKKGVLNEMLINYLRCTYEEDKKNKSEELENSFSAAIAKCDVWSALINCINDEKFQTIIKDKDICNQVATRLKEESVDFVNGANYYITEKESSTAEEKILLLCEVKRKNCEQEISKMKNHRLLGKIELLWRETSLFKFYCAIDFFNFNNDGDHFIQYVLEAFMSIKHEYPQLYGYFEKQKHDFDKNNKRMKERFTVYEQIINEKKDISSYSVNDLEEFMKFHENAYQSYDIIRSSGNEEQIINRNNIEILYCQKISKCINSKHNQLYRSQIPLKNIVSEFKEIFLQDKNCYKKDKELNTIIIQSNLIPTTYWDLSNCVLAKINQAVSCVRKFYGATAHDTALFQINFIQSPQSYLIDNVDKFVDYKEKCANFSVNDPEDYSFFVEPCKYCSISHPKTKYELFLHELTQKWNSLYNEYEKCRQEIKKTINSFEDILRKYQQSIVNVNIFYQEVQKNKHDHFLKDLLQHLKKKSSVETNRKLFDQLINLESNHPGKLAEYLTRVKISNEKSLNVEKEQLRLAANLIIKGCAILQNKIIFNTIEKIYTYLSNQHHLWQKGNDTVYEKDEWNYDFVVNENGHQIIKGTSIVNPLFKPLLTYMYQCYDKDELEAIIKDSFEKNDATKYRFVELKKSKLQREVISVKPNFKFDMTEPILDDSDVKEEPLTKCFEYFCFLFVTEFFKEIKLTLVLSGLKENKFDQWDEHLSSKLLIEILKSYPFYGLVYTNNLCVDTLGQLFVHEKIIVSDDNNAAFSMPFEDFKSDVLCIETLADIFKKEEFEISLTLFEALISQNNNYWNDIFEKNFSFLQTLWGNMVSKAITFTIYHSEKVRRKFEFQGLYIVGTSDEKLIDFFTSKDITNFISLQEKQCEESSYYYTPPENWTLSYFQPTDSSNTDVDNISNLLSCLHLENTVDQEEEKKYNTKIKLKSLKRELSNERITTIKILSGNFDSHLRLNKDNSWMKHYW